MAMRRAAVRTALQRLAVTQTSAFSTLTRSVAQEIPETAFVNAAKAGVSVSTRGFAAEPAEAPATGASKGYIKSVRIRSSRLQPMKCLFPCVVSFRAQQSVFSYCHNYLLWNVIKPKFLIAYFTMNVRGTRKRYLIFQDA